MSSEAKVVRENFDYLVNEVASDLSRIARKAYEKGLVTHATLATASNSVIEVKERATGLVSAIQDKIKDNKEMFDSFLEILREEPSLIKAAATLENERRVELEKEAARDLERSTCGGVGGRSSVGQGNKEGATAREGDSGVGGLSVASHYSESANDGPPDNPADVYGVPPPTVPTAESELSAHAESSSYAFLDSSPVRQEANGGYHAHESDALVPQQVVPGPRGNIQATDGPPSYATPFPRPESLSSMLMKLVAEVSEKAAEVSEKAACAEVSEKEQRIDELTKEKLAKKTENQQLQENVGSVKREMESLELQLKKAQEDMKRMKARATSEGDKLKQEKEEEIERLSEKIAEKNEELLKLRDQLSQNEQQHNELRQERDHVQGQLEEARRHAEESDKKRRESDVARIKLERQMLNVKEERDDLHRKIDELKLKLEQQRHDLKARRHTEESDKKKIESDVKARQLEDKYRRRGGREPPVGK